MEICPDCIDAQDELGFTSLLRAITYGHTTIIHMLLCRGANPDIQDNEGNSSILRAVIHERFDIVKLLSKFEATVNLRNRSGETALNYAISHHQHQIYGYLRTISEAEKMQFSIKAFLGRIIKLFCNCTDILCGNCKSAAEFEQKNLKNHEIIQMFRRNWMHSLIVVFVICSILICARNYSGNTAPNTVVSIVDQ